MSPEISIESALSYSNHPSIQNAEFENRFVEVTQSIQKGSFVRTLLVDDVTSGITDPGELEEYTRASVGRFTDVVVMRESMLTALAEDLFKELKQKLPFDQLSQIKSGAGFSSPFYIAVWTLVRLGYLKHPEFSPDHIANKIINILPASFRSGEEESLEILRQTRFSDAPDHVTYEYIEDVIK